MPSPELFFIETLGELYADVQMQQVFADSKYFVDCIPKSSPSAIAGIYLEKKHQAGFDLKVFVADHFIFPATAPEINPLCSTCTICGPY
jgi:alpha,alpha-trehalase